MRIRTYVAVLTTLALSSFAACSSDPSEPASSDCAEPPATVSFKEDIVPLMRRSCGLSTSCHTGNRPKADLGLGNKLSGPDPTPLQIGDIHASLMEDSATAQGVKRVVPGDTGASFFMHKVDGTHGAQGYDCESQDTNTADNPCGDGMPNTELLCSGEREIFRRWIEQGALSN